jgi:hypothetical protein
LFLGTTETIYLNMYTDYTYSNHNGGIHTATMTLAVPSELKNKMDIFPEINWSEVARQAFIQRVKDLEILKKFKEDSTLTETDALRLGAELNTSLAKQYKKNA